ncbi:MAG: hypothetical protein QOE61_2596 [Micromonosporaceae bacterium]|jgi:hypothetical protein|nr:hypothetical protein [Micromonosporaceae bacterium]
MRTGYGSGSHEIIFDVTTYSPDYLKRLLDAIETFSRAFEEWMATQVESNHLESRGLFPTVWAKEGQDGAKVRELELDLAEAAGAAARAVAVTGAYVAVAGLGAIDPIANWSLMSAPKALISPSDVRMAAATVRGRLQTMISEAEAAADVGAPGFAPSQMHPVIWAAAADHWTTHQYRVAVREAAEALTVDWKARIGRNDVDDTVFWQQTLSPGDPEPHKPKLVWPGDPTDKTTKSMRGGLNQLATGLNLTVRNVATHTRNELGEQEAMERLAAYSYLARMLDSCEIRRADVMSED